MVMKYFLVSKCWKEILVLLIYLSFLHCDSDLVGHFIAPRIPVKKDMITNCLIYRTQDDGRVHKRPRSDPLVFDAAVTHTMKSDQNLAQLNSKRELDSLRLA